jgi:Fe2+ transport system protein FeoA
LAKSHFSRQKKVLDIENEIWTLKMRSVIIFGGYQIEGGVGPVRLADCIPGTKAKIMDLMVNAAYKKRILDLGMLPGTEIQVVRKAPFGGPIIVQVRGYQVGIRMTEAKNIEIESAS